MNRRSFLEYVSLSGVSLAASPFIRVDTNEKVIIHSASDHVVYHADVIIAGGGMGGISAALAALRNGHTVLITEETDWIGGQLTSQGVPPDEHQWIEHTGSTALYREFRNRVRDYYKRNYPLTESAKQIEFLNPGNGGVSRLCHEPKVALAVFNEMLGPYISSGKLLFLVKHKPYKAAVEGNKVESVSFKNLVNGTFINTIGKYFIDATELGDLLPLTGTEYITGTESKSQYNEIHAPDVADPENHQAFTVCFAMDYILGEDHTIPKPKNYSYWSSLVPDLKPAWSGRLLSLSYSDPKTLVPKELGFHPQNGDTVGRYNLWTYRRLIDQQNFIHGFYRGDITIVNWPQNDYMFGNLIDVSEEEFNLHVARAKELSLSLLYWLQTEAPRPDGGKGWKGLRLRKDIMGTEDGLAKYPYIRESRRIKAIFTITEEHVGRENRKLTAKAGENIEFATPFFDTVGCGYYHIDLHPSNRGVNYIDFDSLRFQIPLGALLPVRMQNIFPANKNIGTTHITNGCYRLHPVEWSIGEAVGMLISFAAREQVPPHQIRKDSDKLHKFQQFLVEQGIDIEWPNN